MSTNSPQFDLKLEAVATSIFSPKEDIGALDEYLRKNGWRGNLEISYSGNGGRTVVRFKEVRKAAQE